MIFEPQNLNIIIFTIITNITKILLITDIIMHQDDIALLIAMVMILAAATGTVFFKLYVIDEPPNPNISTFRPLPQQVELQEKENFLCAKFNTTPINPSFGKSHNFTGQ